VEVEAILVLAQIFVGVMEVLKVLEVLVLEVSDFATEHNTSAFQTPTILVTGL
jgi:hypothetical protein